MISNRTAFLGLSIACIAAAATGGYLANRQNTAIVAEPVAAESPVLGPDAVRETEAVIEEVTDNQIQEAEAASAAPVPPTPARTAPEAPRKAVEPRPEQARPASTTARNAGTSVPASSAPVAPPPPELEVTAAAPVIPDIPEPVAVPYVQEQAPTPPPEPLAIFRELVVAADSVIGLQVDSTTSSETAQLEDRIDGRVVRDVRVGGDVAIPAGTRAIGVVTLVEPGGKFKERARLGIRFHTLVLADSTQVPITTETIFRYGEPPGKSSSAKIGGGAAAGAILGAILGGAKGAAIGATAGAGGGTAAVVAGDRSEAILAAGTELTARILAPVTVTVE